MSIELESSPKLQSLKLDSSELLENAPALPPRNAQGTTESEQISVNNIDQLADHQSKIENRHTVDSNQSLSQILFTRQQELYNSPHYNDLSDIFTTTTPNDNSNFNSYLDALTNSTEPTALNSFWIQYLNNKIGSFSVKEGIENLEVQIKKGIPDNIRYLVYLKTLKVRFKFNTKTNFEGLLNKAKTHDTQDYEDSSLSSEARNVVSVLNYCKNYAIKSDEFEPNRSDETKNDNDQLIFHISTLLTSIPELSEEESFYLLLKFDKLFQHYNKDEMCYKINRSLEEDSFDAFKHITSQGLDFPKLYNSLVIKLFDIHWLSYDQSIKVLDFVVMEGFDFLIRIILFIFKSHEEKLMNLTSSELSNFLSSKEMFVNLDLDQILVQNFSIIKFENEYFLIHMNSLTNNSNELNKLIEIHESLKTRIIDIKHELSNLQITHDEILNQSDDYKRNLKLATNKNEELLKTKSEYELKYSQLSMKENLNNTIKANKEFSERNVELEEQIKTLKDLIQSYELKLSKK